MRAYLDYEFHEHFIKQGGWFSNKRDIHVIEQMQVGIVTDSGKTYTAWFNDFDIKAAWNNDWLRENIFSSLYTKSVFGPARNYIPFNISWFKTFIKANGKPTSQIANEVTEFIFNAADGGDINFYGYYSDYDWICFCSMFGKMIALPKGFPMFCIDIKQEFDRLAEIAMFKEAVVDSESKRVLPSWESIITAIKNTSSYPVNKNEHNALDDAIWNKQLDEFLINFAKRLNKKKNGK